MAILSWPTGVKPSNFQARVRPNQRVFTGPYSTSTQVLDLIGEVWVFAMDLPDHVDQVEGALLEALFDRMSGAANLIALPMFHRLLPQGTLRDTADPVTVVNGSLAAVNVVNGSLAAVTVVSGQPTLESTIPQLVNTCTIITRPGKTLLAGDHLGLITGQVVRVTVGGTADGSGRLPIEFRPRARTEIPGATVLLCDSPKVNYRLAPDGVPVVFRKGVYEGPSLEGVEQP